MTTTEKNTFAPYNETDEAERAAYWLLEQWEADFPDKVVPLTRAGRWNRVRAMSIRLRGVSKAAVLTANDLFCQEHREMPDLFTLRDIAEDIDRQWAWNSTQWAWKFVKAGQKHARAEMRKARSRDHAEADATHRQ